jgi:anaerobic selenocysteine-containing dehydrogenase
MTRNPVPDDSAAVIIEDVTECRESFLRSDSQHIGLATMRSHDRYNTTLYSRSDRYRGVFGQRDVVFVSQLELERQGLRPGERVDIAVSRRSMWRASGCAPYKSSARLNRCRRGRQCERRASFVFYVR